MALDPSGNLAATAAKAVEQQTQQAPASPGKAGENDVAKFEQLMEGGNTKLSGNTEVTGQANAAQAAGSTQPVQTPQPEQTIPPVQSTDSSGLVDQLSQTGEEITAKRQEILDRMANSKDLSPKDLLEMQFKLAELTMQQTLLGKAGEKGEQAVQQLFRG